MTTASDFQKTTKEIFKRAGNPFRNYFARNPDDEVCAAYHVSELYQAERDLLQAIIDQYRYDAQAHSEVIPILGNKGAGKTHLLYSIKHGSGGRGQLLVTPGVYQKDSDFLEYLLYQILDTLLGGGSQKGKRPLHFVGEHLVRQQLSQALRALSEKEKCDLFPPPGLGRWVRKLGLGSSQAHERTEWLAEQLLSTTSLTRMPLTLNQALSDAGLSADVALRLLKNYGAKTETHNTAGLMKKTMIEGFAAAILAQNETDLANFLTYGFAEIDFKVRPTRQELVLALLKSLMELLRGLKIPVVVAFDQLEDLLLARRSEDSHKVAESFFAGLVQVMHQLDGICFLIFAERGLWNRFVPSLDGYIQDRLNNPIHVARYGTVKAIRLEAPPTDLVYEVVKMRLKPLHDELHHYTSLDELYPFTHEQVDRIAQTEPTIRDMLQQFRHLFDHLVYGSETQLPLPSERFPSLENRISPRAELPEFEAIQLREATGPVVEDLSTFPKLVARSETVEDRALRIQELLGNNTLPAEELNDQPIHVKAQDLLEAESAESVEAPLQADLTSDHMVQPESPSTSTNSDSQPDQAASIPVYHSRLTFLAEKSETFQAFENNDARLSELWDQEQRAARRKLEPDGALTGASRELQAALGTFLSSCIEQGVKVGPWRLQHVVPEYTFGDHPTYGVISLAHWVCKDSQPWKVGVGLFLAKGPGKPKDLEIKFDVMEAQPAVVDHLILLRPEDDVHLTGKSKTLWNLAESTGKHARLEPMSLDEFAQLYSVPRWRAAIRESLPAQEPLPNLAELIQEKAERLLQQVCMPVQE